MGDFDTFEDSPYYGEMVDHVSREAVENFTALRLCALYDKEPAIAENAFRTLAEGRLLLQTPHQTAAFIHAAITIEVILRGVVLKPIIYGFVHSDSIAPLIVNLAFGSTGLERMKQILTKIFSDVSKLDLMTYSRCGVGKTLWEEINDVLKRRHDIMHKAETVTKDQSEHAMGVATAVMEELFPAFAKSLDYHLHDGFRLCRDQYCPMHPRNVEQAKLMQRYSQKDAKPSPLRIH